ncbi:MAG: helix-turn-helix domain-containing protein [Solirubrobacterales bacterium]
MPTSLHIPPLGYVAARVVESAEAPRVVITKVRGAHRANVGVAKSTFQEPGARSALKRAFGWRLRMIREHRGLSRVAFEDQFNVSGVASMERGRREPRLSDILALCEGMSVSPNALLSPYLSRRRRLPNTRA